ncbi:MAG: biotin/lipoyl-binding protein [Actinobacteria bacterium]|nr:biotin/lipoyl-binding protein [Actinomycetota bacterium]
MYDVHIPKMGMGTEEVDVIEWQVNVGSKVEKGSPLVEVESEKAKIVLESEVSGTVVELLFNNGDTAKVGDIIARINDD